MRALFLLILFAQSLRAQILDLPPRSSDALPGSEFARSISALDQTNREERIFQEVARGNVPDFLRKLVPVHAQAASNDLANSVLYYVTPDYLAVGSDADYFLTPLSPVTAQRLADLVHCTLPTRKMVDEIYSSATVKLEPMPIPPTALMTTVPVFIQHDETVGKQRAEQLAAHPLGELVAGHKKDVVISNKLKATAGRVAIYGWHKADGKAIQPLYTGHADYWVDYSHGIRLVQLALTVNGAPQTIPNVLANTNLAALLSDEGPILESRYPTHFMVRAAAQTPKATPLTAGNSFTQAAASWLTGFQTAPMDEQIFSFDLEPEVKVHINAPAKLATNRPVSLIFFSLPNGNTTAQSIGKQLNPGDDWHFDIQHIGAQTRFLRNEITNRSLVVVYLEAEQKSWPAWRKKHADQPDLIPKLVQAIRERFKTFDVQMTLSGHSGGGSFIFGFLNAVEKIPEDMERIAFLDSNYAYDEKLHHAEKLLAWLQASDRHYLSVLAYHDDIALLNGKPFVSAAGGTWGRSHAMLEDFGAQIKFAIQTNSESGLEIHTALDGRVKFILKENPEKKIYHTVQVEKNGFIQCMVSGTPLEGKDYVYFGDRAYTNWISALPED